VVCNSIKESRSGGSSGEDQNDADRKPNTLDQTRKQLEALIVDDWNSQSNGNQHQIQGTESFNVEHLIQRLLLQQQQQQQQQDSSVNCLQNLDAIFPDTPPLTSAERDRRYAELTYLEDLMSSDNATEDLASLWYSEKGFSAFERLEHADEMMKNGLTVAAEQLLFKALNDYGVHWAEPWNRLATLYYQQDRLEESHTMCQVVLYLKPWHFGALDGIVEVCRQIGNRNEARTWATRALPPLVASTTSFPPFPINGPTNPARARWVENATQQAQEALSHLEHQTQFNFLGNPEDYYNNPQQSITMECSKNEEYGKKQRSAGGEVGKKDDEDEAVTVGEGDSGEWE